MPAYEREDRPGYHGYARTTPDKYAVHARIGQDGHAVHDRTTTEKPARLGRPCSRGSPSPGRSSGAAPSIRPRTLRCHLRRSGRYPLTEENIPLYLIPHIIARAVWERGEKVYRISVIRIERHFYRIRVRVARLRAEGAKPAGRRARRGASC